MLRDVQRKMVQQTGRSIDATDLVSRLPPPARRFTTHLQNPTVLDVAALALVDDTSEELDDFLAVLRLAVSKYLGDEANPKISSEEVAELAGIDEIRLRKVGGLLRLEGLITGGGVMSETPYHWDYEVSDYVHRFTGVQTVEDYLKVRYRPEGVSSERVSQLAVNESTRDPVAGPPYDWHDLHPRIRQAAQDLYFDGHLSNAIFDAFKAVEARVRELSGLDASGRDLMAKAFGGETPAIRVGLEPGQSGRDEQEGLKLIFMGAIQGIRNPKAHGIVEQESAERAFEYLAFASLLLHRLDDAVDGSD